ncbi:N-acetylmuramoyl-L-alanine amidase [Fusicatenibacter sp.]
MPYTIVIDAGHGGSDPGAVYEGRREKDDNLSLAMAVGELLSRQGISVIYTRTADVYQTPFEKAQMANQADADFFLSFHRNSSEEPNQYTGVETLVYDNSGIKQTMAENINGALSELGFRNLGVKARPGLVVLRRTKMPALLIETGFLNNEQDNALYDEKQEEIARAIADAVLGTLDLETVTEADRHAAASDHDSRPASSSDAVSASDSAVGTADDAAYSSRENCSGNPPELSARREPPRPAQQQENASDTPETFYRVQTGLFRIRQNADRMLYDLLDQGYPAFLLSEDGFFKVQVGAYRQLGNAILMERRLRRDGYSTLITT